MKKIAKPAPIAPRKEYITTDGRSDPYNWLRDSNWPTVTNQKILDYLIQENEYADANLDKDLANIIFLEMKNQIQKADKTVPYLDGGYYYYSYILEEQQYWTHVRKKVDNDNEEILLDENLLIQDQQYLNVSAIKISPDHSKVIYLVDYSGDERYTAYVKNISSNNIIEKQVTNILGNIEWDENGQGFFYTPAGKLWRSADVYYHEICKEQQNDKLLYHEQDSTFSVSIEKSSSKNFIFFISKSTTTSEYHFIDSKKPLESPRLIHSRDYNHLYEVVHHQDAFFLRINNKSPNFGIIKTPVNVTSIENWLEFVPPSIQYIQKLYAYKNHLVLLNRVKGLAKVVIINLATQQTQNINISNEPYEISLQQNTFNDEKLRYIYSSLKTPKTTIDRDFITGAETILKIQTIPNGFDQSKYVLKRIWAEVDNNIKVPISLIYNKKVAKLDGSDPLYLYGYGSYGYTVPDSFRSHIFSLVDRGITYAIAHIRGGDELGKSWHESAKLLNKKNTFNDFIKSAEKLIAEKYTSKGNIIISGGSAGGMLVGVCVNMQPSLYKAAIAHVPFVDVLSTMLDESLPLTPGEFKEWGNPKEKEFYDYIKSYSPYDNVSAQNYPSLFVTAGFLDPRVTYWEPAKWVALLRYTKTDDNLILLKTDMNSGHAGPPGRFSFLQELALEYAFIINLLQKK